MLENYRGGKISGTKEQLEKFETFYIEKGEVYEKKQRVKCFKDEIVEETVLNYFTLLSDKSDWIEDDEKLKAWCNEFGLFDYKDRNALVDSLRQNGWEIINHYYLITGDIKLTKNTYVQKNYLR